MDEDHLGAAFRYVALDPVKARTVERAEAWPWSSTRALVAGRSDARGDARPALARVGDFAAFLAGGGEGGADAALWDRLLAAGVVGRPVGAEGWLKDPETRLGLRLTPQKRGPTPKRPAEETPSATLFDG
jgi:putative transposase